MSESHPVVFSFAGSEHHLTVDEAVAHLHIVGRAVDALRVKCPTCRCRILPGTTCACCGEPACIDDESPI